MKIPPRELNSFIKTNFRDFQAVLIYGNDYGSVADKVEQLFKNFKDDHFDPTFNQSKLDFKEISNDPSLLQNEVSSISFNGHNKFIHISQAGNTLKKDLVEVINSNKDNLLIISAAELTPSSSLRKTFETSKNLACVACYHDDKVVIKNLIITKFKENNLIYNTTVLDYLIAKLGNDHRIAVNEIEKITLYFYGKGSIDYNELVNFYQDSNSELSVDHLILYIVNNNIAGALKELDLLVEKENNAIAIIRQLANFFEKIRVICYWKSQGKNETEAFSYIRPPVFYKNTPFYKLAANKLSIAKSNHIIERLIKLEILCKTSHIDHILMLKKFIESNSKLFV